MVKQMEKELNIMKMEILNSKVYFFRGKEMEKESNIMKMEILNSKVYLYLVKIKIVEKLFIRIFSVEIILIFLKNK